MAPNNPAPSTLATRLAQYAFSPSGVHTGSVNSSYACASRKNTRETARSVATEETPLAPSPDRHNSSRSRARPQTPRTRNAKRKTESPCGQPSSSLCSPNSPTPSGRKRRYPGSDSSQSGEKGVIVKSEHFGLNERSPSIALPVHPPESVKSVLEDSNEDDDDADISGSPAPSTPRRTCSTLSMSPSSAKKASRKYAEPEMYAHLSPIEELMRPGLDLVFCGINPGKMSAKTGHHFAHPTNKFWKALHRSGHTDHLLTPSEDVTLSDEYNYGMTNLVRRPTSQQSELSPLEMRLSVSPLIERIAASGPRVICFVGKGIWDVFSGVARKTAGAPLEVTRFTEENASEPGEGQLRVVSYGFSEGMGGVIKVAPGDQGADCALNHALDHAEVRSGAEHKGNFGSGFVERPGWEASTQNSSTRVEGTKAKRKRTTTAKSIVNKSFAWDRPQVLRLPLPYNPDRPWTHTYFWVVPNTSGLERTSLDQQVVYFQALRQFVECLKEGKSPLGIYQDIDAAACRKTMEEMKIAARKKGLRTDYSYY